MRNFLKHQPSNSSVEYKELKQTSNIHFSQKGQDSHFFRVPGLFVLVVLYFNEKIKNL